MHPVNALAQTCSCFQALLSPMMYRTMTISTTSLHWNKPKAGVRWDEMVLVRQLARALERPEVRALVEHIVIDGREEDYDMLYSSLPREKAPEEEINDFWMDMMDVDGLSDTMPEISDFMSALDVVAQEMEGLALVSK